MWGGYKRVMLHQMPLRVVDALYALLGRMFFKVGELDNWQVMPFRVLSF